MPLIAYESKKFQPATLDKIDQANAILASYRSQGYDLTLRQLYYQFVSRGLIPNKDSEYKKLGSVVNDARMAGMIDWNSIVDRTRNLRALPFWSGPEQIIDASAQSFMSPIWNPQPYYVEVWIEKDALVGVIERPCDDLRVPFFSCRGYTSQSEMWEAANRIGRKINQGKKALILHLGDHDPSGIDMTRDIRERLTHFIAGNRQVHLGEAVREAYDRVYDDFEVRRIALTMAQVNQFNPPPNPAKLTDSRGREYTAIYGYDSWELDALDPTTMGQLISDEVNGVIDHDVWTDSMEEEEEHRQALQLVSENWDDVVDFVTGK